MKFVSNNRTRIFLAIVLIALAVATRFLPHPPNFTAVGAAALFAGVLFPKKWGMFLPLLAMVISDIFLGFHRTILFTWGSMALVGLIGVYVRKYFSTASVIAGSLFASIQFFIITNFGVWLVEQMYPHTVGGLLLCYTRGLPFFRNTLLGDMLYTGVLFGCYALATAAVSRNHARENI